MNKTKIALLTTSAAVLAIGVLAGTNYLNKGLSVKAAAKEYTVTYDADHRPYPGTSRIVVNTELGNETYLEPTNCAALGSTGICMFNDNGSYLRSGVPFQAITSIDIDYSPSNEKSLWFNFRDANNQRLEQFTMVYNTTANQRYQLSFNATTPAETCRFEIGSLGNCATIYTITVHYTCE